ncbi:hypothetical protein GALMADRAFT_273215 [Galerina marginata CBS 339.88]|uniref:Uncharacterized protein n=1 Tax=Galerina marginata (strain CBS 339.88) TaxID=685588 RepID=A0A067S946_GALM3|nr:hypothetical protein GALMADRAFT_273215 [Galerina marginata CBS 339.88]
MLSSLPPLWRRRPQLPFSPGRTAVELKATVSKWPPEYASVWAAARRSQSAILVFPVTSTSTFLAVPTILAPMARACRAEAAQDVRLRLTELTGRALQSSKSIVTK